MARRTRRGQSDHAALMAHDAVPDEGSISYVQRSRVIGFPDQISVRAVEVPGGSAR